MNTAAHTPWRSNGPYIEGINSEMIGQAFHVVGEDRDISAVHARLIAAAPELLAALILLEREMVESGNAGSQDYGWKPAIAKTRAAIAKATGTKE